MFYTSLFFSVPESIFHGSVVLAEYSYEPLENSDPVGYAKYLHIVSSLLAMSNRKTGTQPTVVSSAATPSGPTTQYNLYISLLICASGSAVICLILSIALASLWIIHRRHSRCCRGKTMSFGEAEPKMDEPLANTSYVGAKSGKGPLTDGFSCNEFVSHSSNYQILGESNYDFPRSMEFPRLREMAPDKHKAELHDSSLELLSASSNNHKAELYGSPFGLSLASSDNHEAELYDSSLELSLASSLIPSKSSGHPSFKSYNQVTPELGPLSPELEGYRIFKGYLLCPEQDPLNGQPTMDSFISSSPRNSVGYTPGTSSSSFNQLPSSPDLDEHIPPRLHSSWDTSPQTELPSAFRGCWISKYLQSGESESFPQKKTQLYLLSTSLHPKW